MVNKTYNIALDLRKVTAQPLAIPPLVEGDNGNILVITLTNDGLPVSLENCKVLCVFSKTSDGSTVEQDTEDAVVDLSDYGITFTGTPSADDTISVTVTGGVPGTPVCSTGSATVDAETFLEMFPDDGTYVFTYHSDWQYGDNSVIVSGTSHNIVTVNLKTGSFGAGKNNCELQIYSGTDKSTLVTSAQFNFDSRKGIVNEDTVASEEKYPILASLLKVVTTLKTRLEAILPKWENATATATRTEGSVAVTLSEVSGHKNFGFDIPTDVHIGTDEPTGQQSIWLRPDGQAAAYVPQTRTINGYDLTQDRTLSDADIPSSDPNKTTRQYQATQDASISANTSNLILESEGIYIPGDEKTTVFNADGSITVTFENGYSVKTVFNADGSITDTLYDEDNTAVKYKTTTFNADGSISEVIEDA